MYILIFIKIHAPGCPVMIIGTHKDAVSPRVNKDDLSQSIYHMYSDTHSFPKIAGVCFVSNIRSKMRKLRDRIFSVATHLRYDHNNQC